MSTNMKIVLVSLYNYSLTTTLDKNTLSKRDTKVTCKGLGFWSCR